ncbi:MAG: aspartate carbamoyltransferase catalytic subunit [bacterium]|nr:aspartate carbamoyltransferase catalytic subunit [bacterium]
MGIVKSKHLLEIGDFTPSEIMSILDLARSFKEVNDRAIKKLPTLRGRTIVNMFLEPSTRTRTSFEIAAKRLSADAVNMSGSTSSTTKGESLVDTAKTLSAMNCDIVVIRHRYAGAPRILADNMSAHIINGGDGKHQHPTQTLLDLFTMREHFGHLDGLNVAIVGDIAHSRVFGSLAPALKALGANPIAVAPPTLLPARPDVLGAEVSWSLDEVIPEADVLYMLRIQQERLDDAPFPTLREYANLFGLDARRAAKMRENAIVMHPGPMNRGVEVSSEIADDPRMLVLDQVNAGVAVRMAVMYALIGGEKDELTV